MPKGIYIRKPRKIKLCSIENCGVKHRSNGYCLKHNTRFKRWGDPSIVKPPNKPKKYFTVQEKNEAKRKKDKKYKETHKDKIKFNKKLRRALERSNTPLTIKTIQLVYEDNIKKYGTLTCYLCLGPIEFCKDNLEHKTPLSRGGTNEYNNLRVACNKCNLRKGQKTEEEYTKSCS